MNILDRALELCRLDQAMSESDMADLVAKSTDAPFSGEDFARLLAATIMGFTPPTVTKSVNGNVHTVLMTDSYQTRDA